MMMTTLLACCLGSVAAFSRPSTRHQHRLVKTFISTTSTSITTSLNMSSSSSATATTAAATATAGIGFIGLGIMGQGMVARLVSQGVAGTDDKPLVVWNRTPTKCQELVQQFPDATIVIKESPCDVVRACDVTYSMLSTPEASQVVFDAPDTGTLAGVGEGKCIVDCATLAETDMQRMEKAVTAKGGRFLEAPVSGSKGPAIQGSLIFLCAGDQTLFDQVKDNGLQAMGKASHFFGTSVGAGTRAKLVVNSLMGTMLAAFGEGLALAESVGLDPNTMIQVIGQGAIASPMYALKGPKMVAQDHDPNFPLKHAHKDMALASEMADKAGVEYSVMNAAEKLMKRARENDNGKLADLDFSAVYEQIHIDSSSEFSDKRETL